MANDPQTAAPTTAPGQTSAAPPSAARTRRPRGQRFARGLLLLLALAGVALSLLPPGHTALRTALLLPALVTASQPPPLVALGGQVRHSTLTVESPAGTVYLDVYEPVGPPPPIPGAREAVIMIPGVGDNRQAPQLINLATSLARAGLVAVALTTDTLLRYALTPGDAEGLVRAVLRMQRWPGVGADRIGILGFSAAGALATRAATDPRIRDSLAFLTLFGGYYDAATLLRDVGRRAFEVDGRLRPWRPEPVPLTVLANTFVGVLPPGDGQAIADAFAPGGQLLSPDAVARLSHEGQAAYHLLAGDAPGAVEANMATLAAPMRTLLDELSPRTAVAGVRTRIALLHDQSDRYVPFPESRAYAAALTRLGHPYTYAELTIFQHVEVRSGVPLGPLVTDGASLFRLVYDLLLPAA